MSTGPDGCEKSNGPLIIFYRGGIEDMPTYQPAMDWSSSGSTGKSLPRVGRWR